MVKIKQKRKKKLNNNSITMSLKISNNREKRGVNMNYFVYEETYHYL